MARRRLVPIVLLVLALLAGCSDDDPTVPPGSGSGSGSASGSTAEDPSTTSSSSTTAGSGSSTTDGGPNPTSGTNGEDGIRLTGTAGSGTLTYSLSTERSEFCYSITVEGIGTPTEAQVRRGGDEVVLALQPPVEGTIDTCAATDALLIQELQAQPGSFTLEVRGPQGTLRATLE